MTTQFLEAMTSKMDADDTTTEDFGRLTAKAESAVSSGDWATAAICYENLVRARPAQVELKYKLAQTYEELGRLQDAIDLLSDPPIARLNKSKRRLAKFYIAAGNYEAATPLVDELLAKSPESSKLAGWKAICEGKSSDDPHVVKRIDQAQELISAGRLKEGEQVYLQLIAEYPAVVRSYLHLGQIYSQQKHWTEAIAILGTGLALEPGNKKLTMSLARSLFKNGQAAEAIDLLGKADGVETDAEAQFLLQRCHIELHEWGRVDEIAEHLLAILPPDDPFRDSVSRIRQDAVVKKDLVRIDAIAESGDFDAAVAGYRDLAGRYPSSPVAWLKLGIALADAEQNEDAAAALREALRLDAEDMDIRRALTRLVIKTAEEKEILRYVQDAIAGDVADFECFRWLARYHANQNDWAASLDSTQSALAMDPQHASARMLLVRALIALGRFPEALDELHALMSGDAKRVEALKLKADIFIQLGRLEDAIGLYREALEDSPKHPLISHRLSFALLLNGDIEGFHRFYEKRRELSSFIENEKGRPFRDWNGELSIEGKLLVWTESGLSLGHNILHMAFIEPLARLGFDIVFEVEPRLVEISRRSLPGVTVVAKEDELPADISHHTPIGSLSRWFKHDLDSLSSMRPFFVPDVQAITKHRERLQRVAGKGQLLIGMAWRVSDPTEADNNSLRLDQFLHAIASPGITFVDLQGNDWPQTDPPHEANTAKGLIDSGIDNSNDLDSLSAVVAAMDLVVCTDGLTAHIAGAVGTPSFVLLPTLPAPYWLGRGRRCIWYPATTLFRQSAIDGGWEAVLGEVGNAVRDFANAYNVESWLANTLVQELRPFSARSGKASPREIRDAITAFVAQGAFYQSAYRSALELIDRLPADHLSREVQMQRAELLARFGYWEEARAVYAALRPGDGQDSEIEEQILSISLAMYDLEYALRIAQELARDQPFHHLTAANILYRLRRHEEAVAELRAASLEEPQMNGLGTLLGTVLLEMKEFECAEAHLAHHAAITRRTEDYTLLGRSISAQGRHAEALAVFNKGLALFEDDPAANFWRTQERIELGLTSLAPLPPLLGEVPNVTPDDIVIFFAVDSSYFWQHGLVLLGSVGRRSPNAKCHVHVVDPDPGVARAIDVIRRTLPGLRVSYSFEHADLKGCSDGHIRTYYASVRFVRLAEIFAQAPASYLCIDADCIVRDDIVARASGVQIADIGIRARYDERPHVAVAAGALMLSPTIGAENFINRVSALIQRTLETREAVWFLDQIALSQALRELGDREVDVKQLDMTYIDWFFQDHSVVWTGKGPRKLDNRYTDEVSQYRYIQENEEISVLMPKISEGSAGT